MRYGLWIALISILLVRLITFDLGYQDGDNVRISSRVTTDPIQYDNNTRISIKGLSAYVDHYPEVQYGDLITIEGVVDGSKLGKAKLIKIDQKGGGLYSLRKRLVSFYQSSLPEPHSSLVSGIVLGARSSLPADFWETLKSSGTAHVVVASGMNVTFVASFLMILLINIIDRKKAIVIALSGVWIYVVLSGFDAPLVRAAVMGSIAFGAQALGKLSTAVRALFLSAILMLIINPLWVSDLGFTLSFIATLSLILFEPFIYKKISKIPSIIREDLATTISAQIGVAPILFITFGQFNILSPIPNALVLWTIPPIMIIGAIAGLVSVFFEPLAKLILVMVYPLTSWFIAVVTLFG